MPPKRFAGSSDMKVAIIGDDDTVTGFLLTGCGARRDQESNFFIVNSKTTAREIEEAFLNFSHRSDIGIIIIVQSIADEIRSMIDSHDRVIPTVVEIPSKDKPWDPSKDSMLQRVKIFTGEI
eukprot:GDKJ01049225.1.p1 GENE.GDKJ01049225.1~~GDKJ01049225.1.p1  ORF type:complete len:122 (-),score=26.47 GDKJ01049225.1:229-594(-)